MIVVQILAATIVVVTLLLFIPYLYSIWRLPSGRRPLTPEYDRLGRAIGFEENPDFWEDEPDEERAEIEGNKRAAEG